MKNLILDLKLSDTKSHNLFRYMLFISWACIGLYLASKHVFWRDEVRALSFALQGNNFVEMLVAVHGEGHPALWYVLLRSAHVFWNHPQVLPIVAFVVAALSFWLLVFRSQFSLLLIALILASNFALYEYSVMARNYGISMLILFMIAICYKKYRYRGVMLGILLFLLANCNVHSVILVCSFLMFWFFDSIFEKDVNRKKFLKVFVLNAAIAMLGIIACFLTIYPTFNDAVRTGMGMPDVITFKMLINAIVFPGFSFYHTNSLINLPSEVYYKYLATLLLYGSPLVLIKRPSAMFATWATLIVFSCFFRFIYPGSYRHEVLWLVFLISMYWVCCSDEKQVVQKISNTKNSLLTVNTVKATGYVFLMCLMVMQVELALFKTIPRVVSGLPESRSRDLGLFIDSKPELKDAIIIAEEDYMLESLPYYINNPTYLMREQKFSRITFFTKKARLNLTLDDILITANNLKTDLAKPVVVLLSHKLNSAAPQVIKEGYNWTLTTTPDQVQHFLKATSFMANFGPTDSGESYDVYLLK